MSMMVLFAKIFKTTKSNLLFFAKYLHMKGLNPLLRKVIKWSDTL